MSQDETKSSPQGSHVSGALPIPALTPYLSQLRHALARLQVIATTIDEESVENFILADAAEDALTPRGPDEDSPSYPALAAARMLRKRFQALPDEYMSPQGAVAEAVTAFDQLAGLLGCSCAQ